MEHPRWGSISISILGWAGVYVNGGDFGVYVNGGDFGLLFCSFAVVFTQLTVRSLAVRTPSLLVVLQSHYF